MKHLFRRDIILLTVILTLIFNFSYVHGSEKIVNKNDHMEIYFVRSIQNGNLEKIKLYVRNGVDINKKYKGSYPIEIAIDKDYEEIVEYLLSHGADTYPGFIPPLFIATEKGYINIIDVLIRYNADINATGIQGENALHHACSKNQYEAANKLIRLNIKIDLYNEHCITPLMCSVIENDIKMVKLLIDNGAHVNSRKNEEGCIGVTALMEAASYGHLKIVKFLIKRGADVSIKNKFGETALDLAMNAGHNEVVKYLKNIKSD